jgi:hypothetical protein
VVVSVPERRWIKFKGFCEWWDPLYMIILLDLSIIQLFKFESSLTRRPSGVFFVFPSEKGVAVGGVVVSVLAVDPRFTGSNPAEDDGF